MRYGASGAYGQRIYVAPKLGAVVVILSDVRKEGPSDTDLGPLEKVIAHAFGV